MKTKSFRSPKNKYSADISYSKALSGIGSCSSASANDVAELKNFIEFYIRQARQNKSTCTITILENMDQYPKFNWVKIEQYIA